MRLSKVKCSICLGYVWTNGKIINAIGWEKDEC